MALHVADSEVSQLVTELAKLEHTSKTEALRRLLREAVKNKRARCQAARAFESLQRESPPKRAKQMLLQ